jgi:cyclophilin family peptidyl-prolyl cis-trans isomerase
MPSLVNALFAVGSLVLSSFAYSANTPALVELQTNLGTIALQLNYINAPITTANFITYVNNGFYKNTLFHRVVKGFVIQGGGVDKTNGQFKSTLPPIVNESNNGLSNVTMSVAMARTTEPNSATAQFFINLADNLFLNYADASNPGYSVFATVVKGMNVVNRIGNLATYSSSQLPFTASSGLVWIENAYTTDTVNPNLATLRLMVNGSGKVISDPQGIDCGSICSVTRPIGSNVKLTAVPNPGFALNHWSGDCQGFNRSLVINTQLGNHNCTATFKKIAALVQ